MKQPVVYILANKRNGTLYIGVTSNLPQRIYEHRNDLVEGFTKKYQVHRLVFYEQHEEMNSAIRSRWLSNSQGRARAVDAPMWRLSNGDWFGKASYRAYPYYT